MSDHDTWHTEQPTTPPDQLVDAPATAPAAPVAPATAPTAIGQAWRLTRHVLRSIWHGDAVGALRAAAESPTRTGSARAFWLFVLGVESVLVGLTASSFVVKAVDTTADLAGGLVDDFTGGIGGDYVRDTVHVPFGTWLTVFLIGVAIAFVCLVLRVVTIRWTFATRRTQVPFATAANLLAAAHTPQLLVLCLLLLVSLLPVGVASTLLLAIVGLVGLVATMVTEGLVYIGLNRTARFDKSPLVPNAALTLAWLAMSGLVVLLVDAVVLDSILR